MLVNPKYAEPPLTVPLDAPTEVSAEAENAQVTLKWTDPKNKYATPEGEEAQDPQQLVAVWDHTVLVRKVGSNPTGPSDGTVVVSTTVRNQYQTTGYTDTGLVNDTSYHYGVFAINEDGVASAGAFVEATPVAGTPLSQLTEGTIIKINENGTPVEFYLAKHSYEPDLNGAGRELLVRKIPDLSYNWNDTAWNAYNGSSISDWCMGTYRSRLSTKVQSLISGTKFRVTNGAGNTNVGSPSGNTEVTTMQADVFILSLAELGMTADIANVEGSTLPTAALLRQLDPSGLTPSGQWTRTNRRYQNWGAYMATTFSLIPSEERVTSTHPVRPCFTLPDSTLVDENLNLIEE